MGDSGLTAESRGEVGFAICDAEDRPLVTGCTFLYELLVIEVELRAVSTGII